jgi:hypothetical protein
VLLCAGFDPDVALDTVVELSPQQLIVAAQPSMVSTNELCPLPGVAPRHLSRPSSASSVRAPGLEGLEEPLGGLSEADGPCPAKGRSNSTDGSWNHGPVPSTFPLLFG